MKKHHSNDFMISTNETNKTCIKNAKLKRKRNTVFNSVKGVFKMVLCKVSRDQI